MSGSREILRLASLALMVACALVLSGSPSVAGMETVKWTKRGATTGHDLHVKFNTDISAVEIVDPNGVVVVDPNGTPVGDPNCDPGPYDMPPSINGTEVTFTGASPGTVGPGETAPTPETLPCLLTVVFYRFTGSAATLKVSSWNWTDAGGNRLAIQGGDCEASGSALLPSAYEPDLDTKSCVPMEQGVPTLTEWGMIVFVFLLMTMAAVMILRQRRQTLAP